MTSPDTARPAPTVRHRWFSRLASVFRGVRNLWLLLGLTLLLLILLELFLRGFFALKDAAFAPPDPDPRIVRDGYGGAPWVASYFREQKEMDTRWEPYVYFREMPYQGQTIQIDRRGLRRTWNAPMSSASSERRGQVFVFGGSTIWGIGARDEFTIPSLLSKRLAERGFHVEVTNYGEIGYVNTQEVLALWLALRNGARPDLVLFYDGVNEVLSASQNGVAGLPLNEVNRVDDFANRQSPGRLVGSAIQIVLKDSASFRLASSIVKRLNGRTPSRPAEKPFQDRPRSDDELAVEILRTFAWNRAFVEELGRRYGFDTLYYWQPVLFTKSRRNAFEAQERLKYEALEPLFLKAYQRVPTLNWSFEREHFRDLSGVYDNSSRLDYIDFCHTTETANRVVADLLAEDVARRLEARGVRVGEPANGSPTRESSRNDEPTRRSRP